MRKRLVDELHHDTAKPKQNWLDLEELAEIELTSEDDSHPIEHALLQTENPGWRAATPGSQTIRLLFTDPQQIQHIHLDFVETVAERTQEYTLRWSSNRGLSFQEIVRQQWNFSPSNTTSETENHQVDLHNVTDLELSINPDIGNSNAMASLNRWRIT